ncbi:MAG: hypothetical protein ACETV0_00310 [Nitrososphaeria archaeon]
MVMKDYDEIVSRILDEKPGLNLEGLERMIEEKMRTEKYLNRTGAALLVAEELGLLSDESKREGRSLEPSYATKIADLIPGLRDVTVLGRVLTFSPLVKGEGYRYCKMKIGDQTGKVIILSWNERAEDLSNLGIAPGQLIRIEHGYTRERLDGRGSELHVGRRGNLSIISDDDRGIPELQRMVTPIREAVNLDGEIVDVKCTVISVQPIRQVSTSLGPVNLREVQVRGDDSYATVVAWRNKADLFEDVRSGENVLISDLRVRNLSLQTTGRTMVAREEAAKLEIKAVPTSQFTATQYLVRVIDFVDQSMGLRIIIAHDGKEVLRVVGPVLSRLSIRPGDYILIARGGLFQKGRRKQIAVRNEEDIRILPEAPPGASIPEIDRTMQLSSIVQEEEDVVVDAILSSKTPLSTVNTRFGPAEVVNFTLQDVGKSMPGVAWRSKALELDKIPVGNRVRLRWVRVRRNPVGQLEIVVGGDTVFELLD